MSDIPIDEKPRLVDKVRSQRHNRAYDRVVDIIKTLPWIVPITIIVWVYAERKQQTPSAPYTFPVGVRIEAPNRLATLQEPNSGQVIITLAGPSANVQRVVERLRTNPSHPALLFTVPASTQSGTVQFDAMGAIATNPEFDSIFKDNGISIQSITPAELQISVDNVEEHNEIPIHKPDGLTDLEGEPQFAPVDVTIRAPESVFAKGDKFVVADMAQLAAMKQPGSHTVSVPLRWNQHGPNITIQPETVNVTFTVRSKVIQKTEKGVPIWPAGPIVALQQYHIDAPTALQEINLEGTPDQIKSLEDNGLFALLYLRDVREGETVDEPVHFVLPPGMRVLGKDGKPADYTVPVKITKIHQ